MLHLKTNNEHKIVSRAYTVISGEIKCLSKLFLHNQSEDIHIIDLTPDILGENSSPLLEAIADSFIYNAGSGTKLIAPNMSVSDTELDILNDYNGSQLTVQRSTTANSEDRFSFLLIDAPFITQNNQLISNDIEFASYTMINGQLSIEFTQGSTPWLVNQVLSRIQYQNANVSPSEENFILDIYFYDGNNGEQGQGGEQQTSATINVDIQYGPKQILAYQSNLASNEYIIEAGNSLIILEPTEEAGEKFGIKTSISDADDASVELDISSVFPNGVNFFGQRFTSLYIGTNGYITFGHANNSYNPLGIAGYTQGPMIATQFDDIHMGKTTSQSVGGNSQGSNDLYYHLDTINGIVTITWDDAAAYRDNTSANGDFTQGNAYQIRLHNIGNGNFAIELRYESISWAGGNLTTFPTAGWTAGDAMNFGEVTGSGTADILEVENASNIGQAGVFVWEVRDGQAGDKAISIAENSPAGTHVMVLETHGHNDTDVYTYSLIDNAQGRFDIALDSNGQWGIFVANDAVLNYEEQPFHHLVVRSTNGDGLWIEKEIKVELINLTE